MADNLNGEITKRRVLSGTITRPQVVIGPWVAIVTDETIEVLNLELLTNVSEVGY